MRGGQARAGGLPGMTDEIGRVETLVASGVSWIVGVAIALGADASVVLSLSTERWGDPVANVRFAGVSGLRIADLHSDWGWDLQLTDVSGDGLDDISVRVMDPPLGRIAFFARDVILE